MKIFSDLLRNPTIRHINLDGADGLEVHARALANKPMLREVFREFHHMFRSLDESSFSASGERIELGAGVAPIRDTYPDVLATDVVPGRHLDRVLNAEAMDLSDASVGAMYGQNCFHHFPHPERFFSELERVLAPGGGAILLEPYYGLFAAFVYKRLFSSEGFDKDARSWETPVSGPMHGANQALSYIVFQRDRQLFEEKFPGLEIMYINPLTNYLRYLCSGGLNFRSLLPNFMARPLKLLELLLTPFSRLLALHYVIVLRRR